MECWWCDDRDRVEAETAFLYNAQTEKDVDMLTVSSLSGGKK